MSKKKTSEVKGSRHSENGQYKTDGPSKIVIVSAKNEGQKNALRLISQNKITIISGCPGSGKAQPLDAIIYTPEGPTTMGAVKIGDKVCTPDGGSARITQIFPQGKKDIFKITFQDKSTVECCEDHLWKISERNKRKGLHKILKSSVVDTAYLIKNIKNKYGENNIYIQNTKPVYFNEKYLKIDPYVMGVLLGDGALSHGNIGISSIDQEILSSVQNDLTDGYSLKRNAVSCNYRIVKTNRNKLNGSQKNIYREHLKYYGLIGHKSISKFIPEDYLYGSIEQRWAILQGLMDTDGTVERNSGQASFSTSSPQLAQDVKLLIDSLGGLCTFSEKLPFYRKNGKKIFGAKSYTCNLNITDCRKAFRLSRKKNIAKARTKYFPKKIVVSIEKIGQKEAQCIMIDSKDHLYLTNGYTVTHNSHIAVGYGLQEMLMHQKFEKLIFTRPVVEAGESLGFLPGDANAKIAPYMMPIMNILEDSIGYGAIESLIKERKIIVMPLAYMRGVTFRNSYVVADECQNTSPKQMHLLLTRLGENSKIVITGDVDQSDLFRSNNTENGLQDAINRLNRVKDVGLIELGYESCVRDPVVSEIDARYRPRRYNMPTMKIISDGDSDLEDPRIFDHDSPLA